MQDLEKLRHTAAHVLAHAVKELYPNALPTIGPAIEDGFYYDFYNLDIKEEDLPKIEAKMKEIIKKDLKLERKEKTKKEAKDFFKKNKFKLDIISELKEGEITFYEQGTFTDLCRGGHLESTGKVKAVKLMKLAGAYWRGDSKNEMLTRIYGTAFFSQKELEEYLEMLKEAEKRNHIKIGEELKLFTHFDLVGKGLPILLPKGDIIRREIENFAISVEESNNYVRVSTPHIAKKELFMKSGHLPYYKDSMYPVMKMDDGEYHLKAMNCPLHHLIFSKLVESYRDLPLRLAEYGQCYRNELSGTLTGLLRVRSMKMNDAHIYCSKDQIEKEIENVLLMIKDYYKIFGFKNYSFRLSLRDPANKIKYIDEPKNWDYTEAVLRKVLNKLKLPFVEVKDEAAFYGPKIDVQMKNVYGREESMSTVQLDFAAKSRFDLKYDDANGKKNSDVFVIHRAPLSTHERFLAFLIEHFAGRFPIWLSPVQVKIVTINERNVEFANHVKEELRKNKIRVEVDERGESVSKKVRDAEVEKVGYIITIGDKEVEKQTLALRTRDGKVKFGVKVEDFIKELKEKIDKRELE